MASPQASWTSKIPRSTMFLTGFTVLLHCTLTSLLLPVFVESGPARGLIYSATADYRHDSIPVARDALTASGQSINVQLDATEDETRFTDAGLASYDVLIFLMNTGEGSALLLAQWLSLPLHPRRLILEQFWMRQVRRRCSGISTSGGTSLQYTRLRTACETRRSMAGRLVSRAEFSYHPVPWTYVTDGPATSQGPSLTLILRYKMRCV